jgi:glycosyltransferase involved in cell wall biosynthesis
VAELVRRGHDVRAEIAGDAFAGGEEFHDRLVARIAELGLSDTVRLLGWVDDVPALLARTAVFVNPATRPEPFGLAWVEAMGAGVACIATNLGGPAEIIRPDETGLLVPPGDAGALADAIEQLLTDPARRAKLGQAAAADVRARFSIERTVREVENAYGTILGAVVAGDR